MRRERVEAISKAQLTKAVRLKDCETCKECGLSVCPLTKVLQGSSLKELTEKCTGFDEMGRPFVDTDCIIG